MQITIHHELRLALGAGVGRAVQHLLLTPQDGAMQSVREWRIDVAGIDHAPGFFDAYGNRAHLASQARPDSELRIAVSGVVDTRDTNGVIGRLEREPVPALFKRVTPLTRPVAAIVGRFRHPEKVDGGRIDLLHALMARTAEVVGVPGQIQDGGQQSQGAMALPAAADRAHAFIGAARALDIPARYVTGYWSGGADEPAAFHAWAEAYEDSLGWICFDPMRKVCPTERHVRVACGLDALSAAPVRCYPDAGSPAHLVMHVDAVAQ